MRAWAWWVGLLGAAAGARELDPAACAPRFDVQRDKIIRTEESRDMGARYLSELDVGARHECLRLCCETDSCDVFVYEEKSPGSCYLFNCGPPEDFRCKFTAHSNFSSGVLALSRRLAELQDQERLAHHEQELANLRVRSTSTSTSSTSTSPAPPPPPPAPPAHPAPPAPPAHPAFHQPLEHHQQLPSGRCSRYQFECRRGGECIAVYNACDGVPQCADGSDEAPELGCPQPPPPPPPPRATPAAPPPPPPPPLQPDPKPLQAQEPMEALVDVGGGAESALALEEAAARDRWPHRLAQAQAQSQHRYNEVGSRGSSHIFSHKGGLLQEPEPAPQYAPFEPPAPPVAPAAAPAWPRHAWPHQPGMESMSSERGWGGVGVGGGYPRLEWPEPDPRRGWPVPQPRPEPEMPVYIPAKTMPEIPMVYSSQQQTLRDSPKKGFELNKSPPEPEPEPEPESARGHEPTAHPLDIDRREETPPQPLNATNTKLLKVKAEEAKSASPSSEGNKQASSTARRLYAPDDRDHEHDHDGLSEHPPAAVLLLVLGILMTTVMGAMVGCRARAARRRLRRGNKPYAHDADYLVNGMYL